MSWAAAPGRAPVRHYRGWSAVTKHHTPWVMVGGKLPAFDDDVWELYDGATEAVAAVLHSARTSSWTAYEMGERFSSKLPDVDVRV